MINVDFHTSSLHTKIYRDGLDPLTIMNWARAREKFNESGSLFKKLQTAAELCPHIAKIKSADCNTIAFRNSTQFSATELHYEYYPNHIQIYKWSLADYVRTLSKSAKLQAVIELITRMSDALITFHLFGIVHRDVNATNFIIDPTHTNPLQTIKLTDFEIANHVGAMNSDYGNYPVGTDGYAPFEQAWPKTILDESIDQYPLALTFIYILSSGKINPQYIKGVSQPTGSNLMDLSNLEIKGILQNIFGCDIASVFLKATHINSDCRYKNILQFRSALIEAVIKSFREI